MIPIAKPIIGEEEKKAVMDVLESGILAQGPRVQELEEAFAKFCGTQFAVAVNSGTAALHCALYAAGVRTGDEVITVPFTFVATANPILMQGAKIVFVDIDPKTYTIDVERIEEKITDKTKAIIVVDLFGQPADYAKLRELADKHNFIIIEDAAQAHGAEYHGTRTGALGDLGCFSFYATKNMMSGEGGIITTNNAEFAEQCKRFRHHGQSEQTRYEYHDIGYNYRMMDLQAVLALEQLKKIEDFTQKRIEHAKQLTVGLDGIKGITVPYVQDAVKHVFHQFTITIDEKTLGMSRAEFMDHLKEEGVGCGIFYPKPLHLHPHFARLGYTEGDFSVSEHVSSSCVSLPVHPLLGDEDVQKIIRVVKEITK